MTRQQGSRRRSESVAGRGDLSPAIPAGGSPTDVLKEIAAELAATGYKPESDLAGSGTLLVMIANIIESVLAKHPSGNQCDGCNRGLPIHNGIHYDGDDAYMACSANRYESSSDSGASR